MGEFCRRTSGKKVADLPRFNDPVQPFTKRQLLYHQAATDSTPERVIIQYARRYFTGRAVPFAIARSIKLRILASA